MVLAITCMVDGVILDGGTYEVHVVPCKTKGVFALVEIPLQSMAVPPAPPL